MIEMAIAREGSRIGSGLSGISVLSLGLARAVAGIKTRVNTRTVINIRATILLTFYLQAANFGIITLYTNYRPVVKQNSSLTNI